MKLDFLLLTFRIFLSLVADEDSSKDERLGMKGSEVEKLLIGSRELNEEELDLEGKDRSFLALEEEVTFLFFAR